MRRNHASVGCSNRRRKPSARRPIAFWWRRSPELLQAGQADLWDSGEVVSDETLNIAYVGKPLVSNQRCFWQVQTRDRGGSLGQVRRKRRVDHGLAEAGRLAGGWITTPSNAARPRPVAAVPQRVRRAKAIATGRAARCGIRPARVTFNGALASNHLFAARLE